MTALLLPTRPTFHANYNRERAKPKKDCGCGCNGRGDCGKSYRRSQSGLLEPVNRIWTPERKPAPQPWKTREVCEICNRRKTKCCCAEEVSSVSATDSSEDQSESEFSFSVGEFGCPCEDEAVGGVSPVRLNVTMPVIQGPGCGGPTACCTCPKEEQDVICEIGGVGSCGYTGVQVYTDTCPFPSERNVPITVVLGKNSSDELVATCTWRLSMADVISWEFVGPGTCIETNSLPFKSNPNGTCNVDSSVGAVVIAPA